MRLLPYARFLFYVAAVLVPALYVLRAALHILNVL